VRSLFYSIVCGGCVAGCILGFEESIVMFCCESLAHTLLVFAFSLEFASVAHNHFVEDNIFDSFLYMFDLVLLLSF